MEDYTTDDIETLAQQLRETSDLDVDDADDETLADYIEALKELENAVEDARKEVFEAELDGRVDVDEQVGSLTKLQQSRRYVVDEQKTIGAIEAAGGDPMDAMSVKASDAADVLEAHGVDPDDFIEESTYEYFRRQS